ncbi:MAG TPA: GspE/PulE family protein [Candidatus Bipolaricaulota bacterium]|nr:GspE/PulE family protein [Candidatus Bipolaricaulota bacterium]
MANGAQSIEDLLKDPSVLGSSSSASQKDDGTDEAQAKFQQKMKTIRGKEKKEEVEKQAMSAGIQFIDLMNFPISTEALSIIPEEQALERQALVFLEIGNEIRLASPRPQDEKVKEMSFQIAERRKANVEIYQSTQEGFDAAMEMYKRIPKIKPSAKGVEISAEELNKFSKGFTDFTQLQKVIEQTNATEMVALIVAAALQAGTSDIHVEAEEKQIKVRYRLDGILHDVALLKKEDWPKVISRLKLLAKVKLNITNQPQDGRFRIDTEDEKIDVRASFLPVQYGESVVMRLLRTSATSLNFDDLGVRGQAYEKLKIEVARPNGMIITTGPTGSGKTTTLYAILNKLNKQDVKIATLEDPIEYQLEGINQSQVDSSKGYNFAKGLRSLMRQDPDIIMIGEIRDLETSDIAINAALTGHLLLSTIHTNSAAGAIPRFLALGSKGFLLAPALNAIIGQRLTRKICEACKEEYEPDAKTLDKVKKILEAIPDSNPEKPKDLNKLKFYRGKGCPECNNMKYKGRLGIYEILIMNPDIEKLILEEKASEYSIQELGVKQGMITMVQDGLLKAADGITSIEEVFRVSD